MAEVPTSSVGPLFVFIAHRHGGHCRHADIPLRSLLQIYPSASRVSGRTTAKMASAKLKDVFMDNDSDVEQSLKSDAALPINEPEITEILKKKVTTAKESEFMSDSDKEAEPEQSSPMKKGHNRQSKPDSEAEALMEQSKLNHYNVMTICLSLTKSATGSKGKMEDVL
ncbi:hypothetical protein BKA93DRAFT_747562 [Sparassis latifolia]